MVLMIYSARKLLTGLAAAAFNVIGHLQNAL
jgi:hypothetical protein